MAGACGTYGEEKKYVQDFGEKNEGKKLLGKTGRRWEDNNKGKLKKQVRRARTETSLAEDGDNWQAAVNTVRTFAFYKMWGIS